MTAPTAASTWSAALGQLELSVTRANFDNWLRDTEAVRHEPGRFVVGARNEIVREWLAARLRPLIAQTLARVLGHAIEVAFEVTRPQHEDTPALLPLEDTEAAPPRARHGDGVRPSAAPPALNAALTFDTFVVGDENRLAFAAGHAIAQPARAAAGAATAANPFVVFGACGLGKTHLLSAIGWACHAAGSAVLYATAERFGNDYVRAIGARSTDAFRGAYRGCDVLIIDDVQFLEGKEKFQEEFFHAFNELHAMGRRIIVSADRAPMHLTGLSDALRSRLQWGLAVDLQRPAYDTRLAILRAKAQHHAVALPDEALATIAERCGGPTATVRQLEGYLNRVIAYVPLVGGDASRDSVERALSPFANVAPAMGREPPAPDAVIEAVCRRTGVHAADLRGRTRNRAVTYARHLAMYALREDARKSVAEICRLFGNRDHSTVLGGISRIEKDLRNYTDTVADLRAVRESLAPPGADDGDDAPIAAVG
jgi:chromosomal replication initiator protein